MVITGYFDESGTHGESPVSLMAGYIGDARQWRNFEKRARKLFSRFHVDIFHTIDVKRSDRDFKGWTVDKKIEFLDEFAFLSHDALEIGFVAILREEDYKQYYASKERPKKARPDSKYTILVRASIAASIDATLETPRFRNKAEPSLNVVLESGHKNAGDAVRLYREVEGRFPYREGGGALDGITFTPKESCLPLAAADLLAYSAYQQETGAKVSWVPKGPLKTANYRGNLFRIAIQKETLEALHAQIERNEL
jgi:hypothetical protein